MLNFGKSFILGLLLKRMEMENFVVENEIVKKIILEQNGIVVQTENEEYFLEWDVLAKMTNYKELKTKIKNIEFSNELEEPF